MAGSFCNPIPLILSTPSNGSEKMLFLHPLLLPRFFLGGAAFNIRGGNDWVYNPIYGYIMVYPPPYHCSKNMPPMMEGLKHHIPFHYGHLPAIHFHSGYPLVI